MAIFWVSPFLYAGNNASPERVQSAAATGRTATGLTRTRTYYMSEDS